MPVMPDTWIRTMALEEGMIDPFVESQKKEGVISYGLSSYGYDARVSNEFKVFTNVDAAVVNPKKFSSESFVDRSGEVCVIPPNTTPLPAKIYANEGVAQFVFLKAETPCEVSYADRAGKYMDQRGVTLPRL